MLLAITGCSSMMNSFVASMVENVPAPNKIMMHTNPKVGDFAITKSKTSSKSVSSISGTKESTSEIEMTTEITGITDGLFIVAAHGSTLIDGKESAYNPETSTELHVTADGEVKEAWFTIGSKRVQMKIAQPGSSMYYNFNISKMKSTKYQMKDGSTKDSYLFVNTVDAAKQTEEMNGSYAEAASAITGTYTYTYYYDKKMTIPFCAIGGEQKSHVKGRETQYNGNRTLYGEFTTESNGVTELVAFGNKNK
jgi:hypothetical protein